MIFWPWGPQAITNKAIISEYLVEEIPNNPLIR